MRILLLGTFNIGALEHQFVKGFATNNVQVLTYDITKEYEQNLNNSIFFKVINRINQNVFLDTINEKIITYCKGNIVDVIFVSKGLTVFPETLEEIKKYCKLLVNYNPDHPYIFYSRGSGNNNIKNSINKYDLLFSYSKSICEKVKNIYNTNTYWLPFGYDPNIEKMTLNTNKVSDRFLFVGAYDKQRLNIIESLKRDDFDIFGDKKWGAKSLKKGFVRKCYRNANLYGDKLIYMTNESVASINILRPQNIIENSHNMRTFEVPAMGGTLLSRFTDEQASFFEPNKEMLFYHSEEELSEKLIYLKKHPDESLKIKKNALERSRKSNYNYTYRCKEMISVINFYLKS